PVVTPLTPTDPRGLQKPPPKMLPMPFVSVALKMGEVVGEAGEAEGRREVEGVEEAGGGWQEGGGEVHGQMDAGQERY
ncbi:hypothetical protein CYMTET_19783, partial [Cymbomonas tetramitiformis]